MNENTTPGPRYGTPWRCLTRPLTEAEQHDFIDRTRGVNEHNIRVAEYATDRRAGRPIRLRLDLLPQETPR